MATLDRDPNVILMNGRIATLDPMNRSWLFAARKPK